MSDRIVGSIRTDFIGDFLGFTYNGRHSSEFGIVRVSSSNRYEDKLLPTIKDKTVEVPGGDGTYYFGSQYTQRQFNINIAFDSMSEFQLHDFIDWLGDQEIHTLSFDESDYKFYKVKCTGTPSLKYLCFENVEGDVYKGEGSITFTAFYPFAMSEEQLQTTGVINMSNIKIGDLPNDWIISIPSSSIVANTDYYIKFQSAENRSFTTPETIWTLKLTPKANITHELVLNSMTELVVSNNQVYNNWIASGYFKKMPKLTLDKYYRFQILQNTTNITSNCRIAFQFLYY